MICIIVLVLVYQKNCIICISTCLSLTPFKFRTNPKVTLLSIDQKTALKPQPIALLQLSTQACQTISDTKDTFIKPTVIKPTVMKFKNIMQNKILRIK